MENLIEKEELIQNCLEQGNKESAVKLLFDLVVDCAKEKNFEAAEAMRSRIFEIDAMAFSEIIRSGGDHRRGKKPNHRQSPPGNLGQTLR